MGFFSRLFNIQRPRVRNRTGGMWDNTNTPGSVGNSAPADPNGFSPEYPYENFFIPGPNPEPYLRTGAWKDPNRLHAYQDTLQPEIGVRLPGKNSFTTQRDVQWDAGNPDVIRSPRQASQRYFDERTPLPEFTTPSMPSHAVMCSLGTMKQGWEQATVPEPGMRQIEVGAAPVTLLSRPINVKTSVGAAQAGATRAPIKKAKAPKRHRSGG